MKTYIICKVLIILILDEKLLIKIIVQYFQRECSRTYKYITQYALAAYMRLPGSI